MRVCEITACKLGARSALAMLFFGIYWVKGFRRFDVVCEKECDIERGLVDSEK